MPIFGDTSVGAGSFPTTNDRAIVGSFVLTDNADCTSITNRFDASSTAGSNFKGLIYADSGGLPGALVAVGAPAAIPAGGGLVDSAVTVTLAPGTYWLGGVVDSFQGRWQTNTVTGGQRRETHTYASPASSFTSPSATGERVQAYVTYTVSGGGSAIAFTGTVPTLPFVVGVPSSVSLASYFSGSATPFTYALDGASAALPSGVTLSSAGLLSWSGIGSVASTSGIIVQGTDTTPNTADTNAFAIDIQAAPLVDIDAFLIGARGTSVGGALSVSTVAGTSPAVCTVLLALSFDPGSVPTLPITDSKGNVFTPLGTNQADSNSGQSRIFVKENGVGGTSHNVTVAFTGGSPFATAHLIYIEDATDTPLDVFAQTLDAATPYELATGVLGQANELVIAMCGQNTGTLGDYASSNFTIISQENDANNFWTSAVGKLKVTSASSVTPSFTRAGSSAGAAMIVVSFRQAAATGPAIGGHSVGLDFIGDSDTNTPTGTFNTQSSGSIILASVARGVFADLATCVVSDNKGNGPYTKLGASHTYTDYPTSGTALYAKTGAIGGTGHIVNSTKPSATDEVTVIAAEFRNVNTIVDYQWNEDLTSPNTSLSVTTTDDAILCAFWWGDDSNGNLSFTSINTGFTELDKTTSLASNHVQAGSAYKIVGAGTHTVEWTPSTSQGAQLYLVAMQQVDAVISTIVPKMRTPYERLPRGGDDVWDQPQASVILASDVFDSASATLAKVWNGTAWVVKPVKYWNGSAWVTKPIKRWSGSAWV